MKNAPVSSLSSTEMWSNPNIPIAGDKRTPSYNILVYCGLLGSDAK
jgi:hypothetical protein